MLSSVDFQTGIWKYVRKMLYFVYASGGGKRSDVRKYLVVAAFPTNIRWSSVLMDSSVLQPYNRNIAFLQAAPMSECWQQSTNNVLASERSSVTFIN